MAQVPAVAAAMTGQFAPGAQPFQVGAITLGSIECPARIHFGKVKQTTVVTEFTGGGRDVQTFGVQPQPLEISGTFWANGSSAENRVADFLAYAVAGQEILLTWSQQKYWGVITEFDPGYYNAARCSWSMTVEVVRDANGALFNTTPPSLDQQVSTITSNTSSANNTLLGLDPTGAASFQSSLTAVQTAIANATPLAAAAGTAANTALSQALTAAQAAVSAYVDAQSTTSQQYTLSLSILTNLQLIAKNVAQGQTAITSVMPMGSSFWEQSVLAYGSVDFALPLAAANNAVTMRQASLATSRIVIPPYATPAVPTPLPE